MSAFRVFCFMAVLPVSALMADLTGPMAPEAARPGISPEALVPAGPAESIPDPPPIITDTGKTRRYDSPIPGMTQTDGSASTSSALPADAPADGVSDAAIDAAPVDESTTPDVRDTSRATWYLEAKRARLREQKRREYGVSADALQGPVDDYPDALLSRPSYRPESRYLKRFRSQFRVNKETRLHRYPWWYMQGSWGHRDHDPEAESLGLPYLPRVRPFEYHEYDGPWPWECEEGADTTVPDRDRISL